jgi:hypothetical protein
VGLRRGLELGRRWGKVARGGGFSGSYIEPRAPAHADNHPESNLLPNQRSLEYSEVNSLPYLISPKFVCFGFDFQQKSVMAKEVSRVGTTCGGWRSWAWQCPHGQGPRR